MDYSLCPPVGSTNISYPIQKKVVPTMQNGSNPTDTVSFSGTRKTKEKKNHTWLWVLGGLAGLGVIFRKNIAKSLGIKDGKVLDFLNDAVIFL